MSKFFLVTDSLLVLLFVYAGFSHWQLVNIWWYLLALTTAERVMRGLRNLRESGEY